MYLLLVFAYWWILLHKPPLILSSTINSISIHINSIIIAYQYYNNSTFTSVFFKATCYSNPKAEGDFAGSNWQIFKYIFLNFQKHQPKVMHLF